MQEQRFCRLSSTDEIMLNNKINYLAALNYEGGFYQGGFFMDLSRENQIKHYTQKMLETLDYFKVSGRYSYKGCEANVKEWFENKNDLISHLRRHPDWNEEAKAVILTADIKNGFNFVLVSGCYFDLIQYLNNKVDLGSKYCEYLQTLKISSGIVDGNLYHEINMLATIIAPDVKEITEGTKVSKALHKIFKNFVNEKGQKIDLTLVEDEHEKGNRNFQSFEKLFAKLSDALNPLCAKRKVLISVNILDCLTMSHGNSWSSCHYINSSGLYHKDENVYEGSNKAGTLSYSNDSVSMCFYTLDESYNGTEYHLQPKINRQMFFYKGGKLLQSRLYPNHCDEQMIDKFRSIVQNIIAECEGVPSKWEEYDYSCLAEIDNGIYTTFENSLHFMDYDDFYMQCNYSELPSVLKKGLLMIGDESYCLSCGAAKENYANSGYNSKSSMYCEKCHKKFDEETDLNIYCAACGARLTSDDEIFIIENKSYCRDDVVWCEYHARWEVFDYDEHFQIYDICDDEVVPPRNDIYICHDALEEEDCEFAVCECCHNAFLRDDLVKYGENEYYCPQCEANRVLFEDDYAEFGMGGVN